MRTRKVSSPSPARDEEDGEMEVEGQLQFSEPLSWQAGRAIPTAELLKRLPTLAAELKDADQETIDRDALVKPAADLAHPNLLRHKDNGVRSWTAHCLIDILRLAAPHAPLSGPQLKVMAVRQLQSKDDLTRSRMSSPSSYHTACPP